MRPAKKFQSTKPQRLRQEILAPPVHKVHFNPRSRKGFDPAIFPFALSITISIHEAAKASTYSLNLRLEAGSISIHEAAKASTVSRFRLSTSPCDFNPRSRKGFDISSLFSKPSGNDFNPRSRKGFDHRCQCGVTAGSGFQSTKPQRLRPSFDNSFSAVVDFNPRSRKGFDTMAIIQSYGMDNFNPRSRKGFDSFQCWCQAYILYFNPRSRKGFDLEEIIFHLFREISIHEAAKASTSLGFVLHDISYDFNPRSRKGFDSKNIQKTISFLKTIYTHIIISPLTITTF